MQAAARDIILLDFLKDPETDLDRKFLKETLEQVKESGKESDRKLFTRMFG